MKNKKIIVALLVAICLISAIAIGIPNTIAKNESSKDQKFLRSDNPLLHLPIDEEKWLPIVPPEPVGRLLDEDAEKDLEMLVYDVKTKKTKKILKNFTKSENIMLKLLGSQGSLPSELILESPIGYGDRVRVTPTTDYPWRTICKLLMQFPSGGYMGSGFIIDDYHILTAGHCVYDPNLNEWASSIEIIPALDWNYMPFYHTWATEITVSSYWHDYGWYEEDFAILTLDRNIGDFTGWMGLYTSYPSDPIYTSILNTAGYPGDLDGGWNMYRDSDLGYVADEFNHWYWMDTRGGQSGSPVWYYDDPDRYVLSIVAYETPPANPNFGTRLSQYWFDLINYVFDRDIPPIDYANLIDDGQAYSGFEPTTIVPGETDFSAWSDIRNIGTAESGIFQVSYYASTDTEITASDYLIGVDEITSITPFAWTDSDWSGTFPNIPAGTYYVGWIIDSTDAVPELLDDGEYNNIAYKDSYQLKAESTALITYYTNPNDVGSITFNYDDYTDGQSGRYIPGDYTVTANAPTGYAFHHWEYDHIGEPSVGVYVPDITANPVTATVSGDGWLKAAFSALITFRTDPSGIGSITYGSTDYTDGQSVWETNLPPDYSNTVTVTANPQTGYEFARWECTGILSVDNQMANPATLTVGGTGVLSVVFSALEPLVITDVTDLGGTPIKGGVKEDTVVVLGNGATAGAVVNLYWDMVQDWSTSDGAGLLNSSKAKASGAWEIWFRVPEATNGTHYIYVEDSYTLDWVSEKFYVYPTIELDFENGPVGTVVTVSGNGFTANGFVDKITINGTSCTIIGAIEIDVVGTFTGSFVIPGVENLGIYEIIVTDSSSLEANSDFIITGLADISLNPEYGALGDMVEIVGENFTAINGEIVSLELWDKELTTKIFDIKTLYTDTNGEFSGIFNVPPVPNGNYKIVAVQEDFKINASKKFTVGLIFVVVKPLTGATGEKVTISGIGFTENGGWNATFGEVVIFYNETVDADGTIYGLFHVPMVDVGTYTITVFDIVTEIGIPIEFFVTNKTMVNTYPSRAPNDYNVTIEGLYFTAEEGTGLQFLMYNVTDEGYITDEWLMDVYQGSPGTAAVTDKYGGFTAWWVVPDNKTLDDGDYNINVTDSNGFFAQKKFTVGTNITVSIDSAIIAPGHTTGVPVNMSHVTKIAGLGFDLYWNPDVVNITGIRLSDDLSPSNNFLAVNIDPVLGKATVALLNTHAPDYLTWEEERPVLIVDIEAIGLHGNFSILDLEAVEVSDAEGNPSPVSNVEDGMVTIQNLGSVHGYVTYSYNGAPMEGATVELSRYGATINTTVTGVDGEYEFLDLLLGEYNLTTSHERIQAELQYTTFWNASASANVTPGETTEVDFSLKIRGDLNDNGEVDIGDVAKTANMYVGNIPEELDITDFNGNGSLDIGDVAKLANYYVENMDEV